MYVNLKIRILFTFYCLTNIQVFVLAERAVKSKKPEAYMYVSM